MSEPKPDSYKAWANAEKARKKALMEAEREDLAIVERFRQSHHAVATYFALGYTPSKICQITGKSRRSLHILWNNPMFQELMAQKRKTIEAEGEKATEELAKAEFEVRTLMTRNLIQAEQFIAEKLEAADHTGELPGYRELHLIASDRADRLGYSKHTTVTHTHDFASQLDRAISRSNRRRELTTIEGEVLPLAAALPDFSNEPLAQPKQRPVVPSESVVQPQVRGNVHRPAPEVPSFVDALRKRFA